MNGSSLEAGEAGCRREPRCSKGPDGSLLTGLHGGPSRLLGHLTPILVLPRDMAPVPAAKSRAPAVRLARAVLPLVVMMMMPPMSVARTHNVNGKG